MEILDTNEFDTALIKSEINEQVTNSNVVLRHQTSHEYISLVTKIEAGFTMDTLRQILH